MDAQVCARMVSWSVMINKVTMMMMMMMMMTASKVAVAVPQGAGA
jgi:hypothetical protein